MNLGSFSSGLLTGLREGVEAALIVSIILAYLARTGNGRHFSRIWLGTAAAALVSLLAGTAIYLTTRTLPLRAEQLYDGVTMLVAAAVVTWMLFWMRRQAASVKGELHSRLDRALTEGSLWGLAALAFTQRLAKRESCRKQCKQEIEPRPGGIRQITNYRGDSRQNEYVGIQPRLVFGHRPRHQGKVADDGPQNTEIPLRSP